MNALRTVPRLVPSPSLVVPSWKFEASTPARIQVRQLAQRIANSSCPVMILGPTGVGKEVLANDIHRHSGQASGPFVSVNCAAFPTALFDSAFFGHVRGSFTGATTDKPGFIELANGGTLFLDEVGDLPLDVQGKLLRFLANGTYWPVGGSSEKRATVRIISATHRRIDFASGDNFREDLFFRMSVVLLRIPALEVEDIGVISRSLARDALQRHGKSLSSEAFEELSMGCMAREWRGGVRELNNAIERFVILLDSDTEISDQLEQALGIDKGEVQSGIRARKCEAEMAKTLENLLFLGIARECTDVRQLAEMTDRTVQAVYGRLKKLGLGPDDVGSSPLLQSAIEQHRERIEPHQKWIQSVLLGK